MTEIQPSPPGYCGQDEAPGTTSCSPGSFKYTGHVHHAEQHSIGNYVRNSASPYSSQDDYLHKQSGGSTRGSSPGEQQNHCSNGSYRRKSESTGARRNALGENENAIVGLVETNNHSADKKATFDGYNEGYRKNTPGYKNDSGYSESIGFDSFSLPLNERDDASPPPTPPVRDASSLKGVCYGPGHEKYPSWPSAPERHPDEELHENSTGHSGSHRSKSWTDHTNYPKEKPAQYTRPLAKRPNPAFTQQLKTVMERCEKIPVETFESRGSRGNTVEEEPRLWPRVDREGKPLGDAEYVLPSPPEREQQQPSQTISHAELEAYVRSYQDPRVSQVDIYGETGLTQAGLEEYTRVQHSQQASYAQSEGYHSYVSSVDSTTNTPFLDRLRRDSEAVTQRAAPSWEEASREGRDSVVTTSSGGSASSSETLKWHGSMSDVSVSSGLPVRQVPNDRWDRGSMSDVSSVNGLVAASIKKTDNNHENKWQSSMSDLSTSILLPSKHSRHSSSNSNITGTATITTTTPTTTTTTTITTSTNNTATNSSNINNNNNNKWKQEKNNKWQASMNDRNCKESSSSTGRTSLPAVINHCTSLSDVCQASLPHEGKWQESSIDEETLDRPKASSRNCEPSLRVDTERYNCVSTKANPQNLTLRGQLENGISSLQSPDEWDPLHGSLCDVSQSNQPMHSSKQLIAHSARVQTPQRHHSESVLYLDRERSQRKHYRLNSTQSQDTNISSEFSSRRMSGSPISPQKQAHLSVAERISELEKQQQQQMRYTYLDPEKRHRVSDPTLKAIQKKALLSFYERHQSSWRSEPQLAEGSVPTAQSPPPQPPPRPRASSSRRASSASDYSSETWRDKTGRALNAGDVPSPKHQHSNSCGSLSMDLLGPVIVGPAISIDDWVPERPPKKPHLRTVYNDRVPSPDLPPPSPPTVTENEVVNCDEPLPPPPPELSDSSSGSNSSGKETSGNANVEEKKRHRTSQQPERQSTRRSKHGKRSERVERSGRTSPIISPSKSNSSKQHHDDAQRHFVRATSIKHADSDFLMENGVSAGFATHRMVATGRSSLRYPSTQKMIVNERAVPVKRVSEERRLSSRPPARLPDLIAQRYSDSGNQRPAPQVPVESRIIRQESMRVESTRIDVSGLLRNDGTHRYESSSGQRPQPQVPKNSNGSEKNVYATSSSQQHSARPNYLAIPPDATSKCSNYSENTTNHVYSVGSPVKTGYEASSKLLAEASPQKYHEPPKYVPGHHQRHGEIGQRNYYALPPKYNDAVKQKQPQQSLTERHGAAISPASPPPPPLAPRQNTPGRKSLPPPPRPAPPQTLQGSQSKASYLAYRRERGAPDSEGSYKRTMSPTARLEDWQQQQHSPGSREYDDPVLLRVTPHHPHELQQQEQQQQQLQQSPHHHHHHHHHHHSQNSHPDHHQQHNQQQLMDLPKSHSVDALHQRIEERNSVHSSQVMGKLSHELTKKLQATENRSRSESNNNNNIINNNDCDNVPRHVNQDKRHEYKERLSPQSVQVLNDRNRQLERERRKLAASCEPVSQTRMLSDAEASNQGIEDFYRERSATIEMTSRNVELLNRRNALTEKTLNGTVSSSSSNSSCINASPTKEHSSQETVSDSNCNLHIKENDEIRNIEDVEKPPAPISSPPRSPNTFVRSEESSACQQTLLGAISRRSGSSCSSSSSNETSPTLVSLSRKNHNNCNETLVRNEPNQAFREYDGSETTIAKCHTTSRRKVSSPSQTENSWTRSNSPRARSSQTEGPNASIELGRIYSPRSRSSSLSSASKISSTSCSLLGSPRYSPIESKNSPCVSPQPGIEGLTMVQRSEIVLRVNAATSDAASQTDIFYEDEGADNKDSMDSQVVPEPRRKLQEEIECDELSRDLASQLEPNDKLVPILVPVPEHKKPTDYVSGLFRVEATLQPRPRRSISLDASNSVASVETETEDDGKNETMHSTPTNPLSTSVPSSPLSATSAYFTTSEGKARFLTRYSRDVSEEDISSCSVNSPPLNAITSSNDSFHLRQKKEELVLRLEKKVVVLRAEQEAVREEGELNEALGARVAIRVYAVARPAEASKYRLHVEEVGKITSLLLGLSGRLARAENALYGMPANHPERKILESKRDKLMDQLSEAKILKSNIDKRSVNVSAILAKYLNDEEYADYQHFINMKAKLIMDGREIQDKVKLGEEQLAALKEAIN